MNNFKDIIKKKIFDSKISNISIEINSECFSKCVYCPVRDFNRQKNELSVDNFEYIILKIIESDILDINFNKSIFLHLYNEALLHSNFEKIIEILRKYHFTTLISTNGIPLTKEKTKFLLANEDVIPLEYIQLHLPYLSKKLWTKATKNTEEIFDIVNENISFFHDSLPTNSCTLISTVDKNTKEFIMRFPKFRIIPIELDNSRHLASTNIFLNKTDNKVIGCNECGNDVSFNSLRITAEGNCILCCSDYKQRTIFGNVLNGSSIEDIWKSEYHIDVIMNSFKTICKQCKHSIKEKH